MADIFISYSKAERELTESLAEELAASGYDVWWDTNLVSGERYQKTIVSEIEAARAVIVIWTPSSTQSEWVYSEANRAARRNKLIPVRLPVVDVYDIPPPFDVRHTDFLHNRKAIYAALARLGVKPVVADAAPVSLPPVAADDAQAAPTAATAREPAPTQSARNPVVVTDAIRDVTHDQDAPLASAPPASVAPPSAPVSAEYATQPRKLDAARALHWQKTKRLASRILLLWTIIALAVHLGAATLNQITILGFPLGFYLAAQGSLLGFLALLGWFVQHQNRIDRAVMLGEIR